MTDLVKFRTRHNEDVVLGNLTGGETDQAVADFYNATGITPDEEVRATREQIMEALDVTEFKSLSAATRDAVTLVLLPDSVVLRGSNARDIILDAFGAGTNTRANLLVLQTQLESEAERTKAERGDILGNALAVSANDVKSMRAL